MDLRKYDMRAQFIEANLKHELDKLEVLNILQLTAHFKLLAKKYGYDYDVSQLAYHIFMRSIFKDKDIKLESLSEYEYKIFSEGIWYRGDTMNSWSTTINEYMRIFGKKYLSHWNGRLIPLGKDSWEEYLSDYKNYTNIPLPDYLLNFMEVVYYTGNILPVPHGDCNLTNTDKDGNINFNTFRYPYTNDYWDLTLLAIYSHFMTGGTGWKTKDSKPIEFCNYPNMKVWLDSFIPKDKKLRKEDAGQEGWNNFVKSTYMQDFVTINNDGNFGKPKELWINHFTSDNLPKTEFEFIQFFTNAYSWIIQRTARLVEAENG